MACASTTPQKSEAAGLRPTKIYERRWECVDCTPEEKKVVAYLQDVKINDKNAIATLDVAIGQLKNSLYATHEDLGQTTGHQGFKKLLMARTRTLLKII